MKTFAIGFISIAFLYAVMLGSLSLVMSAEKSTAISYMKSNCELIGNAQGQRWYECDEN